MSGSATGWATRAWAKLKNVIKPKIKDTVFLGNVPDDIILCIVDILAAKEQHGTIALLRFASHHHYALITEHLYKGNPFPDDVMLNIVGILSADHKLGALAALRSTTQYNYQLITSHMYREVQLPECMVKMLRSVKPLQVITYGPAHSPLSARLDAISGTELTAKLPHANRLRLAFTYVQNLTLDSLAIERMSKAFFDPRSSWGLATRLVVAQLRLAGHEVLPNLRQLTYRYDERDGSRTHEPMWFTGHLQDRYRWDPRSQSYDYVRLVQDSTNGYRSNAKATALETQDAFRAKVVCVVPRPSALGPVPLVDPSFFDRWAQGSTAACAFRAQFATVHNVNGKPCQLPNANVVRVVFLADGIAVTRDRQNQAVDYLGRPITRKKRYDEVLLVIRGMLANLGDNVKKVVFVGVERSIDPNAVSDLTKAQFYRKLTKTIRRARLSRDRRLDRQGKSHQKLRHVMFDGKADGNSGIRRCGDCGTVM